ncbi:MAG: hypothetical protein GY783_17625 [Gammaproteobacteria bacterium]|nr:hypothetical protein [Gammaproteobacteria bacterium]
MQRISTITALFLAAIVGACTRGELPVLGEPVPLTLPAGTNVVGPRFSSSSDGTIVLSWMQRQEKGAALRYSTLEVGK